MNDNKMDKGNKVDEDQQQQQRNPQRPEDLESQGQQKGAQQIPSSQPDSTKR